MKKLISLAVLGGLLLFASPADAQIKYGIRGGANFADLHLTDIKTNTSTGWFVGVASEFLMPVIGLGLDASFLYSNVKSELEYSSAIDKMYKIHYLSVPVNIKYKLGLPIIKPFIYAGPELCLRLCDNSKKIFRDLSEFELDRLKSRGTDIKVNVGAGVELMDHLEVFVNYNVGLTNTIKHVDSKTKMWRVGATFFF